MIGEFAPAMCHAKLPQRGAFNQTANGSGNSFVGLTLSGSLPERLIQPARPHERILQARPNSR